MTIDTHCHLPGADAHDASRFTRADAQLDKARAAGVRGFVVIGVGRTLAEARHAVEVAQRHSDVVAAVGVHPHDAKDLDEAMWAELETLAAEPRVAAVGEMGLDYHYDYSPRERQREVFRRQIDLARRVRKPVVIHTRQAGTEALDILEAEGAGDIGGVFHCFSEDRAFASRALSLGFDLSFSGIVTFPKAQSIQEVASSAPIERILVETDAPYLAPVPFRGKRCEPAMVVHTARFVAELRGIPFEVLASQSAENARRRFSGLPS